MKKSVVLIGVGEMGGVFARGFLKLGFPVCPVTRQMDLNTVVHEVPDPAAVVVAVAEKDLTAVLKTIPRSWCDRLVLLQNELLPRDWQAQNVQDPTVISVWFEKKAGQDFKVLIPSPIFGPRAPFVQEALTALKITCRILPDPDELLFELVLKNLYILTINTAGLLVGGTVSELWGQHQKLARDVAYNVLDIQEWLTGNTFDRGRLMEGMCKAFDGDPQHKCLGRTALSRLERAITQADEAQLKVTTLREIAAAQKSAQP